MQPASRFIIHGIHITENLLHHKASDVRRILEEKDFREETQNGDGETAHFYPASGKPGDARQTTILFDDRGFVLESDGIRHSG